MSDMTIIKTWDQLTETERFRKVWDDPYELIRRAYQLLKDSDRKTAKMLEKAYYVDEPVPAPKEIPQAP